MSVVACDFCSKLVTEEEAWLFPCRTFVEWTSPRVLAHEVGAWVACSTCDRPVAVALAGRDVAAIVAHVEEHGRTDEIADVLPTEEMRQRFREERALAHTRLFTRFVEHAVPEAHGRMRDVQAACPHPEVGVWDDPGNLVQRGRVCARCGLSMPSEEPAVSGTL